MTSTDRVRTDSGTLPVVLGGPPRSAVATVPWPRPAGREMELLGQVVSSENWGFDGPLEAEFERKFAAYQDAKFCPDEWDGLSATAFRRALGAELGVEVSTVNEPLNRAPLYQPHTKRRYRLSAAHWEAVNPARSELPMAVRAYRDGVLLPHKVLLDDDAVVAVGDAIARLHEHRHALARADLGSRIVGP